MVGAAQLSGRLDTRVPLCLLCLLYASAALETALVAGGSKCAVLDVFAADRRMLRVGCPGKDLLYA